MTKLIRKYQTAAGGGITAAGTQGGTQGGAQGGAQQTGTQSFMNSEQMGQAISQLFQTFNTQQTGNQSFTNSEQMNQMMQGMAQILQAFNTKASPSSDPTFGLGNIFKKGENGKATADWSNWKKIDFGGLAGSLGVNSRTSGGISQVMSGITNKDYGAIADGIGNALHLDKNYNGRKGGLTKSLDGTYDKIANVASKLGNIPVIGKAAKTVGMVMKIGGLASKGLDKLGVGTDKYTKTDAWMDSNFLKLTPLGLANALGAQKTNTFETDQEVAQAASPGYQSFNGIAQDAEDISGIKLGLFSGGARKDLNNRIYAANKMQNVLGDITESGQKVIGAGDYYGTQLANDYELRGGWNAAMLAKHGSKILNKERIKRSRRIAQSLKIGGQVKLQMIERPSIDGFVIEHLPEFSVDFSIEKPINEPPLGKYRSGGKLGDTNVIPEGALHAHLNKMDGADEDFTKKGIPVITEEKGKIEQQAEIERNEIIFRKEVTQKLEKLMKDGSDEAAIEAGELLVHEILFNTEDNTGLLKEVV